MTRASRWTISLAAKCRLLFGSAVLLIIAAALFMPWLRMRDLVHESHLHTARLAGRLAIMRVGRGPGDWERRQTALANWWPTAATDHGFDGPVPELIALSDPDDPRPHRMSMRSPTRRFPASSLIRRATRRPRRSNPSTTTWFCIGSCFRSVRGATAIFRGRCSASWLLTSPRAERIRHFGPTSR